MEKFPYKDDEVKVWIYDQIPPEMELATSTNQIKINTLVLYKPLLPPLSEHYVAIKIKMSNIHVIRHYVTLGNVYIRKSDLLNCNTKNNL